MIYSVLRRIELTSHRICDFFNAHSLRHCWDLSGRNMRTFLKSRRVLYIESHCRPGESLSAYRDLIAIFSFLWDVQSLQHPRVYRVVQLFMFTFIQWLVWDPVASFSRIIIILIISSSRARHETRLPRSVMWCALAVCHNHHLHQERTDSSGFSAQLL